MVEIEWKSQLALTLYPFSTCRCCKHA